jgi:L-asparaginase/Glu-tRNA(Gln) amidotransferase subunit D
MNHSIYSADRSTHLKVVVVALVAGIVVAGLGISARAVSNDGYAQTARVIKADKPIAITSSNALVVR